MKGKGAWNYGNVVISLSYSLRWQFKIRGSQQVMFCQIVRVEQCQQNSFWIYTMNTELSFHSQLFSTVPN